MLNCRGKLAHDARFPSCEVARKFNRLSPPPTQPPPHKLPAQISQHVTLAEGLPQALIALLMLSQYVHTAAEQQLTLDKSLSTSWYACCASPSFRRPSLDSEIICTSTCLISRSFTSTRSSGVTPTFCTQYAPIITTTSCEKLIKGQNYATKIICTSGRFHPPQLHVHAIPASVPLSVTRTPALKSLFPLISTSAACLQLGLYTTSHLQKHMPDRKASWQTVLSPH